jgi:hypothetical protein
MSALFNIPCQKQPHLKMHEQQKGDTSNMFLAAIKTPSSSSQKH